MGGGGGGGVVLTECVHVDERDTRTGPVLSAIRAAVTEGGGHSNSFEVRAFLERVYPARSPFSGKLSEHDVTLVKARIGAWFGLVFALSGQQQWPLLTAALVTVYY